jgi:hypothetical protein
MLAAPPADLIDFSLGKVLRLQLVRRHDTVPATITRGALALGPAALAAFPAILPERMLVVQGALPALDIDFWRTTLASNENDNGVATAPALPPLQFDLRTDELRLFKKSFSDIRLIGSRTEPVTRFELKSPDLTGSFSWDATGAGKLNTWLHDQGTFTDFEDLGDAKIFAGATPNCAIWRYEKGNLSHRLRDDRRMVLAGGQMMFTHGIYSVPFRSIFMVKVGAVSGADEIFTNDELGNMDFVCSRTAQTGETRRMIYLDQEGPIDFLQPFKDRLLARRVTDFDERNWWKWGRRHHISEAPRIYVNGKTRNAQPFFIHPCRNYDGAVLALFPKRSDLSAKQIKTLTAELNSVDWHEQGFVCDGRFLFSQRSLEQTLLPEFFAEFASS